MDQSDDSSQMGRPAKEHAIAFLLYPVVNNLLVRSAPRRLPPPLPDYSTHLCIISWSTQWSQISMSHFLTPWKTLLIRWNTPQHSGGRLHCIVYTDAPMQGVDFNDTQGHCCTLNNLGFLLTEHFGFGWMDVCTEENAVCFYVRGNTRPLGAPEHFEWV